MLCDHCGKNEATTTLKQLVNGQTSVQHLCSDCAEKLQITDFFANPFFNTTSLFSSLLNQRENKNTVNEAKRCAKCGTTLRDILSTGNLGCSACVGEFYQELLPTIRRIHGNAVHNGKVPQTASVEIKTKRQIETLEAEIKKEVALQNFERAAELRDEINRLKGAGSDEKVV